MNIYVSKEDKDFFIEKLKEIPVIDEYILDRERLGKEKIKVVASNSTNEAIEEIVFALPVNSMIVDQTEYPGKEYILCVGEITTENFSWLISLNVSFSIITRKEKTIRFNAWVHFKQLEDVFNSKKIEQLSSINGEIKNETFFLIEAIEKYENVLFENISKYTSNFIIRENAIYVKILMKDFTEIYNSIENKFSKIEIIEENAS